MAGGFTQNPSVKRITGKVIIWKKQGALVTEQFAQSIQGNHAKEQQSAKRYGMQFVIDL